MKLFKKVSLVVATLAVVTGVLFAPVPAQAVNVFKSGGDGADVLNNKGNDTFQTTMGKVISALFFVLGFIAVVMIIIGGFRYVTSNGDSSQTKSAKDTIMYAVIGLVVAIFAYAIVNFTLGAFK